MMWSLSLLSMLFAVTSAWNIRDTEECEVGPWTSWGPCSISKDCTPMEVPEESFKKPASTWDEGRNTMNEIMEEKIEEKATEHLCVIMGMCPDAQRRPTDGENICKNGLAGDIPCLNVDQKSFLNLNDLGYTKPQGTFPDPFVIGNDCWGWTDSETGDEYALMCTSGGTSFVRITDPINPVVVAFIYGTPGTDASPWRDVKVVKDHAYIVSEAPDHGLQVFDLTRLRGLQELEYLEPDSYYTEFGHAHNIVANEETKFVYGVGSRNGNYTNLCGGGLYALDVSEPKEPRFAGCFGEDGYTHDAQCVVYRGPDDRYFGKEICFAYNEDTLTIVDVDDKNNMVLLSKTSYTDATYTHQGWLTEDHTTVLMGDEVDETKTKQLTTYIWDVRDLESPVLKTTYRSKLNATDHNLYIVGKFVYQANYQIGLRVLYIDEDPYDLHEVAYFDVFPSADTFTYGGIWSVYPYFSSGTVILSSIEYGLFVVRPDYDAMEEAVRRHETFPFQTRTRELISHPQDAACPPLEETRPCQSDISC